jgi:hypothetical protein
MPLFGRQGKPSCYADLVAIILHAHLHKRENILLTALIYNAIRRLTYRAPSLRYGMRWK